MTRTVRIPTVLRPLTEGEAVVEADGDTIGAVFKDLDRRYPGLGDRLLEDEGGLHRFVNVFLGDEDVRYLDGLETPVPEDADISILPAVAGG